MLVNNGYLSRFVYLNDTVNSTIRIILEGQLIKMFTYKANERAQCLKAFFAGLET